MVPLQRVAKGRGARDPQLLGLKPDIPGEAPFVPKKRKTLRATIALRLYPLHHSETELYNTNKTKGAKGDDRVEEAPATLPQGSS